MIFQERMCREWRNGMGCRWAFLREEVKACLYADHIDPGSGEKIPDVGEENQWVVAFKNKKNIGSCAKNEKIALNRDLDNPS